MCIEMVPWYASDQCGLGCCLGQRQRIQFETRVSDGAATSDMTTTEQPGRVPTARRERDATLHHGSGGDVPCLGELACAFISSHSPRVSTLERRAYTVASGRRLAHCVALPEARNEAEAQRGQTAAMRAASTRGETDGLVTAGQSDRQPGRSRSGS